MFNDSPEWTKLEKELRHIVCFEVTFDAFVPAQMKHIGKKTNEQSCSFALSN